MRINIQRYISFNPIVYICKILKTQQTRFFMRTIEPCIFRRLAPIGKFMSTIFMFLYWHDYCFFRLGSIEVASGKSTTDRLLQIKEEEVRYSLANLTWFFIFSLILTIVNEWKILLFYLQIKRMQEQLFTLQEQLKQSSAPVSITSKTLVLFHHLTKQRFFSF